jgi:renalase
MHHHKNANFRSVPTPQNTPRVAVIGAGIAGLTCARELCLRGYEPVVFEASDRLGGRCSSRDTRVGAFDDAAQSISGNTHLASYTGQRPGELAALHSWTVPATAAEDEPKGRNRDKDQDEADVTRTLKPMGSVGVPSMRAFVDAIARPLDVRLRSPIHQAQRRSAGWVLHGAQGEIAEHFQAVVLAVPAPLALPLAQESPGLMAALSAVRYRSRWVLLLGSERAIGLPGHWDLQGGPIEKIAAMHCKPGRSSHLQQRWYIQADEQWSLRHEHDDAETVAELLLDNFRAHVRRSVTPNYLHAHQWRHAFAQTPPASAAHSQFLWDDEVQLGVCGDSVVASQVDKVHRSGVALARIMADGLTSRCERGVLAARVFGARKALEAQAAHG